MIDKNPNRQHKHLIKGYHVTYNKITKHFKIIVKF